MIDPRELRIGNYVLYHEDGTIFKVTEIYKAGLGVENDTEETWIEGWQFSPIKVTPTWLEKIGFEPLVGGDYAFNEYIWLRAEDMDWDDLCLEVFIRVNSHGTDLWDKVYIGIVDPYVHSVQNYMYAIAGIELELKQENE